MGQRKPQANKRKKKKRSTDRRYSDGEASDYDAKVVGGEVEKEVVKKPPPIQHQDSGVDMSDDNLSTNAPNMTDKQIYSNRQSKKKQLATKYDETAIEFKSDMIFDIEM